MYLLAKDFTHSDHRWSVNALSERLELPSAALGPLITSLENSGLIVGTDDERLVPGRDLATITLAEIVDAVRRDARNPRVPRIRCAGPAEQLAHEADQALRDSLAGRTLKDLIEPDRS
jgi:DNA-binding IscR family transcriptional regulator